MQDKFADETAAEDAAYTEAREWIDAKCNLNQTVLVSTATSRRSGHAGAPVRALRDHACSGLIRDGEGKYR